MTEAGIPSLKTILMEEIAKEQMLLSEDYEQLDEFAILNKLSQTLSGAVSKVKDVAVRVWKQIIERIKKALAMIKKLGKKAMSSLRRFFGLDISNAKITKTGGMYPVDTLIFNK
jgi:hypothetical protein